ncbi:MDR family MFS transporter [Fodinicola feengrottensis]|uniref:MDR family MFS transporter n=2 Tax=Fodinicola feengrottensis TaxID=435914 RepID=A0ABN2GPR0_9ACTN
MLVFAIVSIALFMASMDQTIVATALTTLQHDLGSPINWTGWTITIYSLGQIVAMPLAGKISDLYGRKKVFLISAAVFTVSSLCCGLVDNIYLLVFFRALQALGGGAFMPSATGIVSDQFGRQRDRALGMFTSIFPIGGIVGPIIGGLFVTYGSWRGIFLVNVPIGVALILLGLRFIPARRPVGAGKLDLRGVAMLALLILSGMFGISSLGTTTSPFDPVFLGAEAFAVLMGWLFIRHTKHDKAPFIPIRLLRGPGFGVMNLINLLFGSAALGFGTLVPLYAEQRYGISQLASGTLLTARAIGMICVAGLAVLTLRRTGCRLPIVVGFLIVTGGLIMMFLPPLGVSPYLWLAVAAGVTGIGMGLSVPATNNASLQLAPDQVAAIAGLRGMFRQSGSIIAVSVVTAILARSATPGMTQAYIFVVFAAILICVLPLVRLVPDHRGSW